jgi:hypothetical protein
LRLVSRWRRSYSVARMRRREFLKTSGGLVLAACAAAPRARAAQLPAQVAGITLPRSDLARHAAAYARASCPPFLFNHCMRTFVFGALQLRRRKLAYRADEAFVAAALHDLGLLPAFESPTGSFEVDGADAAERWARSQGVHAASADRVWHAIELHDGAWPLIVRTGPEAQLLASGAGIDVAGPDAGDLGAGELEEVIAAFPRLQFKRAFTELLIGHCQRKPRSQRATWLEGLCRAHSAQAPPDSATETRIAAAAFAE